MVQADSSRGFIRFSGFEVDVRGGEVRKHGIKIKLQDQPFRLLQILLEHPGEVVTREELQRQIWPSDTFVDFDRGLNNAVKRLREALGDSAEVPRFIETLPRRGYRFLAILDSRSAPVRQMVRRPIALEAATDDVLVHAERTEEARPLDGPDGLSAPPLSATQPGSTEERQVSSNALGESLRLTRRVGLALAAVVLALAFAGILFVRARSTARSASPPIHSVAILPLENLTGDPSQEYFSDGMTDALITELAQVRGLRVISRSSTMHYKGTRKTLPEIARELQADAIVEGTVARNGNEVKITAQLIRAATDAHLWAGSYTRVQRDVLRLQTDVAEQITRQIGNEISPFEHLRSSKALTVKPEAYEAYLKGTYFLNKMTPDAVRASLHYYEAAIGNDPSYASAYAKLSACYLLLSMLGQIPSSEAYAHAREAAEKAVALDENLGEAHQSLGDIAHWYDWDWSKANREYRRAIELNPNDAFAHLAYFELLLVMGRHKESAEELRKARELDPLSLPTRISVVSNSYFAREYETALLEARATLELYPEAPLLHTLLSNAYTQIHRLDLAADEAFKAEEYEGASQERLSALRRAYRTSGTKALRRRRIDLNRKGAGEHYLNAYDIAYDYAALLDKDQTFYWLDKTYSVRDPRLQLIAVEPGFDGVRSDPRFNDLVRRLNFPSQISE